MLATLEKVKRLEQYLSVTNATIDPVSDQSIDKILAREEGRLREMNSRLSIQVSQFETQYDMTSNDFYQKYTNGSLGDAVDFIEWAATLDMLANNNSQMELLTSST